jgi:hypothetical protein
VKFEQLQVKVTTLNKSLLNQLEVHSGKNFDAIPIIHGWVNVAEGEWFIIEVPNGQLGKMSYVDMWDVWVHTEPKLNMDEARKAFYNFQHNYEQIFI